MENESRFIKMDSQDDRMDEQETRMGGEIEADKLIAIWHEKEKPLIAALESLKRDGGKIDAVRDRKFKEISARSKDGKIAEEDRKRYDNICNAKAENIRGIRILEKGIRDLSYKIKMAREYMKIVKNKKED